MSLGKFGFASFLAWLLWAGEVQSQQTLEMIQEEERDAFAHAYTVGFAQTVYIETYVVPYDQVCHKRLPEQTTRGLVHLKSAGSGLLVGRRQVWTADHVFPMPKRKTEAICALVYYSLDRLPITSERVDYGYQPLESLNFEGRDLTVITLSVAPPGDRSCIRIKESYAANTLVTKNGFIVPPVGIPKELGSPVSPIEFGDSDRSDTGAPWLHSLTENCVPGDRCKLTGPSPNGNSGGPVWSATGELLGLLVAEQQNKDGMPNWQNVTLVEELISKRDYIISASCTPPTTGVGYKAAWTSISDPTLRRDGIPVIELEITNGEWENLPAEIILQFPDPLDRLPLETIGSDAAASISFLEAGIVITDDDIENQRVAYRIDWSLATQGQSVATADPGEVSVNSVRLPVYYASRGKQWGIPMDVTVLNGNGEIIPELSEALSDRSIVYLRNSGLFEPTEIASAWLSRVEN